MKYLSLLFISSILSGCFTHVRPEQTERIYKVSHNESSTLAAFDRVEEWIGVNWISSQDVLQTRIERTGTLIVKWMSPTFFAGVKANFRSSAVIKVSEDKVTFILTSSAPSTVHLPYVYEEWDGLLSNTPWGAADLQVSENAPNMTRCRSDRDCDRGYSCNANSVCAPVPN